MKQALTIAAATTVLSFASIAGAQQVSAGANYDDVAYGPGNPRRDRHIGAGGFEMAIHGGGGGFLNDSSTAFRDQPRAQDHLFWPGFAAQTELGWRFGRAVSLTGHFMYQNNQPRDLPMGTTDGWLNSYAAGVSLRAYIGSILRIRYVDPWVSAGFDPWAGLYSGHATPLGNVTQRFTAVAIPMSIGVDFNIVPQVALGIMGQVSPWIPWEACGSRFGGAEMCTRDGLSPNWYGFFGGTARFTITR